MKKSRGLSFIEVILFIAILGLSIPPLLNIAADVYNKSINLETMHIATNLANQKMEDVISKDFGSIVNEPLANFPGQFGTYQYQVDVNYTTPANLDATSGVATRYKRIEVSVKNPGVAGQTITFKTVVTNE